MKKVAKGLVFGAGSIWCMWAAVMMVINGSAASGWGLISMLSLFLIGWETLKTWTVYVIRNWHLFKEEIRYKEDEETDAE